MSQIKELLPPEDRQQPFMAAAADAMSDTLPIPLPENKNPYTAEARFLKWLAAEASVDFWYDDWTEERKREIIAHSLGLREDRPGEWLEELVGTVAAAPIFLSYVDAEIIDKVAHPARRPVGRFAVGVHPLHPKAWVARYLVRVGLKAHKRAFLVGRSAVGRAAIRRINREPLERAKRALTVSKAPETAYSVNFAHRTPLTLDDGLDLDAGVHLGSYKDRIRL